jgi:mevalonate kinase
MRENEYYSNGKLLLTGEYLLMYGALSLALPLKLGQTMRVRYLNDNFGLIHWHTYVQEQLWFQATLGAENLEILNATDRQNADYIQNILVHAARFAKDLVCGKQSKIIETYLDFSTEFGLGSSSTLISNIAYWINADPFIFFRSIFEGSGYDIACARSKGPILYQLIEGRYIETPVSYQPSFCEALYFVYTGNKAHSISSVQQYKSNIEMHKKQSSTISFITQSIINAASLEEFECLITEHENILSKILSEQTIKSYLFNDFPGAIKSLGAWGGDFIMAASKEGRTSVEEYFKTKGLTVLFGYPEIVL